MTLDTSDLRNVFRSSKKQVLYSVLNFHLRLLGRYYYQGISHNSPAPWVSCCTESFLHFHYHACFPWWPGVASKHCSKWREPREKIWKSCLGSCLETCDQLPRVCILVKLTGLPHDQMHSRVSSPGRGQASGDLRSMHTEFDLGLRGLYLLGHAFYTWNLW